MYRNICNSFSCTLSFGVLQKICAQNNQYGQIHTAAEPITNQNQQHKFLTKTHTKNPVLPKKKKKIKRTDGIPWAFLLSQKQAGALGLLSSVEHGATAFSDVGEDRLYNVHKLEEKLEDAPSALLVSGSTESYIHEGTALSQSSISSRAMEYHKPATTQHTC